MAPISADRASALQRVVLRYYSHYRRDLPWRRTRDPYRILVSEIMLQRTQVERVIPKYRSFLSRFPTIASLARARLSQVLRAWVGLGYNSRALRLWRCAQLVSASHAGRLPPDEASLRQLPGVGQYTAAAVTSFAFGGQTAAVDVNVRRVLTRTLSGKDELSSAAVARLARAVLPRTAASEWTQALMDIGSAFCRAKPECARCPARNCCIYRSRHAADFACDSKSARSEGKGQVRAARKQSRFAGSTRFYRGRIIRSLTIAPSVSFVQLGRQVKEGFAISERPWLLALLRTLEREGLVKLTHGAKRISLP